MVGGHQGFWYALANCNFCSGDGYSHYSYVGHDYAADIYASDFYTSHGDAAYNHAADIHSHLNAHIDADLNLCPAQRDAYGDSHYALDRGLEHLPEPQVRLYLPVPAWINPRERRG